MTGLFRAYVDNFTSERGTIWARYAVMVTVHTIILTALGVLINTWDANWWEVGAVTVAGLALCFIWYLMTWLGWETYRRWEEVLCRFSWPKMNDPEINPFVSRKIMKNEDKDSKGLWLRFVCSLSDKCQKRWESFTYLLTCLVIIVFALGYLALVADYRFFKPPTAVGLLNENIETWHFKTSNSGSPGIAVMGPKIW